MDGFDIFMIGLIYFVFLLIIFRFAKKRSNKKIGILASDIMLNHSGLEITNGRYTVNAYADKLEFVHDRRKITLPYERIENITMTTEINRITQSKGVLGRSVVGGAVAGPIGAVVGGMTGQSKIKKQYWPHIVITYTNKSGGKGEIILKGQQLSENENLFISSFYNKLKKLIPSKETNIEL